MFSFTPKLVLLDKSNSASTFNSISYEVRVLLEPFLFTSFVSATSAQFILSFPVYLLSCEVYCPPMFALCIMHSVNFLKMFIVLFTRSSY